MYLHISPSFDSILLIPSCRNELISMLDFSQRIILIEGVQPRLNRERYIKCRPNER